MPDFEAVEVLTQAKERIFECGWTKGAVSHRLNEPEVCLEQALCDGSTKYGYVSVSGSPARYRAAGYVRSAIGEWADMPPWISCYVTETTPWGLFQWNDEQNSAGPVMAILDDAILLAKEAPTPEMEN